jgi:group I intron endonuclease
MPYGEVYLITNRVNRKIYVGQTTVTSAKRFSTHVMMARRNPHQDIDRAIRKYGKNNFIVSLLSYADSQEELNRLEIRYIAELRSHLSDIGYNRTFGGRNNGRWTDQAKQKLSKIIKDMMTDEYKAKISAGVIASWTPEIRKKVSAASTGRHLSEETRKKISIFQIGRIISAETREKISKIHKGVPRKPLSSEHKDAIAKGLEKTHCKRNHLLSEDNLYWDKKGKRHCKECRKLYRTTEYLFRTVRA